MRTIPPLATFGIGSLPHTQQELALQQALRLDIPTLPTLPREDPSEFMLPQAIEGLPGLRVDEEGRTTVHVGEWRRGAAEFGARLEKALGGVGLEAFEPSGPFCRAWKPFLWEIEQARAPFAKAQIAGPLTTSWATTLTDGAPIASEPGLSAQVVRLVMVRALALSKAIAATGAQPVIFLDEPGLYAFDKRKPAHVVELREVGLAAEALRHAGAIVGLHCCGNTDWASVLALPIDVLSTDLRLSLGPVLSTGPALDQFLARGGRLALGIVPTNVPLEAEVEELVDDALALMGDRRGAILAHALVSPACGLGMRTVPECERAYDQVREAQRLLVMSAS